MVEQKKAQNIVDLPDRFLLVSRTCAMTFRFGLGTDYGWSTLTPPSGGETGPFYSFFFFKRL
jgi:hypothetical protein